MSGATPSDEVVISRVFAAPRELMFEMWTVADHFVRWFGPHSAKILFCDLDTRPGGLIHFCHEFEDGTRLWVKGVFADVVAGERLVFRCGFVDAEGRPGRHPARADWPLEAVVETTVLFGDTPEGTSVTVYQHIEPAQAAASAAVVWERRLARQGWSEVFDRLAEQLKLTRKEQTP